MGTDGLGGHSSFLPFDDPRRELLSAYGFWVGKEGARESRKDPATTLPSTPPCPRVPGAAPGATASRNAPPLTVGARGQRSRPSAPEAILG